MDFYHPHKHQNKVEDMEVRDVRKELRLLRVRLTLISAFVDFLRKAYDALQHHSVDYKKLPEYLDTTLIDKAESVPLSDGHDAYINWIERLTHGLAAAVRRKGFKKV